MTPATLARVPVGLCEDYPEESTTFSRVREDMTRLRELGVTVLRVSFPWDTIEPRRGRFDWRFWDRFVRSASEHGVRLIPYVAYAPAWAVRTGAPEPWHEPPRDPADFEKLMRALSAHYRGRIRSWELWNEPDNRAYWTGTASQFAELVHAGARGVRSGDPSARIVLGGIAWNTDYLAELFEKHGIARDVDVVNIHSYAETWIADRLESIPDYVDRAWRVVHEHGEGEPLWMAEMGYSSLRSGRTVSDQYTARFDYEHTAGFQAVALLRMLVLMRSTGKIDLAAWYRVRDLPAATGVIGDENNRHLGILQADGTPKPAADAFRFARQLLEEPLRAADGEVALATTGAQPEVELHAFARGDGSLVVFAWIPTNGRKGKAAAPDGSARSFDVGVRLRTRATDAVLYDELGRVRRRARLEGTEGSRTLRLRLRDGGIEIAVVSDLARR